MGSLQSACVPNHFRSLPPSSRRDRAQSAVFQAALCSAVLLAACSSPSRAEVAPEESIAAAAGLPAALEFRIVGPEGGPIDESVRVDGPLSLGEALRRAVTTDPGLQSALARVHAARARADQARLLPNPVLDVIYRAGSGSPQIEAAFMFDFVAALQRPDRSSAADNRLRSVAAETLVTALDVIGELQERYVAAQTSAALLPLLEERLALVAQLVATAQDRLDVGEGTRSDLVTLAAQRVELEVSIDRARLEQRTQRLRLARLIGEPASDADWTLETWRAPQLEPRSEIEWTDAALRGRPEIQALVWRLRTLGDEAALVRLLPFEGASVGVDAQRDDGWQVGPALSTPLPLFDTGSARRDLNFAEQLEARHELTLAKRVVVEEVRTAYHGLAASVANLGRIERELIPLQVQRRQLAEDAYRAGQTDVTPLFLAEQDLRVAQTQAIEVEAQAALALVRLQRAVGGPGVADGLGAVAAPPEPPVRLASDRSTTAPSRP